MFKNADSGLHSQFQLEHYILIRGWEWAALGGIDYRDNLDHVGDRFAKEVRQTLLPVYKMFSAFRTNLHHKTVWTLFLKTQSLKYRTINNIKAETKIIAYERISGMQWIEAYWRTINCIYFNMDNISSFLLIRIHSILEEGSTQFCDGNLLNIEKQPFHLLLPANFLKFQFGMR